MREIGFGPVTSINNIHNVKGKPTLSVHAINALLRKAGVAIKTITDFEDVLDKDGILIDKKTTIRFYRRFESIIIEEDVTFTWTDAQKMELTSKDTWKKMPGIMLWNRCLAIGARRMAPDALLGLYETSELADVHNVRYRLDEDNNAIPI